MEQKIVDKIGWFASLMAITMYVSYIDQIKLNLSGQKGSAVLPAVTVVNCISWVMYGYFKEKKDWPIIVCNLPGVVLGAVTFLTAIL